MIMSDEGHNKLAAKLVAHERLLGLLLAPMVKGLTQAQRDILLTVLSEPAGITAFGPDIDIGTADDLAGLAMHYREAIQRVFNLALSGNAAS